MMYNININCFLTLTALRRIGGYMGAKWLMRRSDMPGPYGKFAITMFVLTQCLDGIFTYKGVSAWGPGVEGNPFFVWVMALVGVGLGVSVVKLIGVGMGILLYLHGFHNYVIVATLTVFIVAIIPWVYVLLTF